MDQNKSFKKKLITGFAWESSTKLFVQLLSWSSTIYVARLIAPEDYGIVAISGVFTGLCLTLGGMGLNSAIVRGGQTHVEVLDGIFWFSLLVNCAFYAFLYFASPYVADYYDNEKLLQVIRISGLVLIASSLNIVPVALQLSSLNFKYLALTETASRLTTVVVTLVMAHAGYGLWSLIYSVLAGQFLQVFLYFPKMNRIPRLRFSLVPLREALRFGLTVMGSTILQYFRSRSGVLIVSIFLGERQTGYYQYANSLAQLPSDKVGQIFRRIAFHSFASIRSEPELLKQTIVSLHRALLLISIPTLGGLAIVSDDMVTVFLTEKWRPVVPLLQLLCAYNLFEISERILPSAIESTGRAGEVFKYHLAALLIVGAAMLLGAQRSAGWMLAYSLAIYPLLYASLLRRALVAMQMSWIGFLAPLVPVVTINVIISNIV